ncbi:MAG: phage terminase large subunit [Proteobacteria bacterium]|nr:phage terminase large subunit [Pseudomonadota bacterium]
MFETTNQGTDFLPNWHIQSIAWHLEQCVKGDIKRLIITLPPRHLKSLCASVALPISMLGRDPTRHIICASYSDDLARNFSLQRRTCMRAAWYRRVFPNTRVSKKKDTEHEIVTTKGGSIYATSIGGTLTGRGANLVVIDDPIKTGDAMSEAERKSVNDWFQNTLYSRLNNKNEDVIIIVMQRVHVDDLVGHVLGLDDWTVLSLPAIATEAEKIQIGDDEFYERAAGEILHLAREDEPTLARIKQVIGSHNFEAQYQQTPAPPDGNLIKRPWFRRYAKTPGRDSFIKIVQSWDTATGTEADNSFSVCTTWGVRENAYYLLDVYRKRLPFPDLVRAAVRLDREYVAHAVLIENAGGGQALMDTLRENLGIPFIPIRPRGDKETRVAQVSAVIEGGRVFLPEEAPWLAEFEREVLSFPLGKFDDQVDSMTQFLRWSSMQTGTTEPFVMLYGSGSGVRDLYFERTGIPTFF